MTPERVNLWWRRWVLSFAMAALLLVAVAAERNASLSLAVPLELEHVPPALAVVSPAPRTVRVTVTGPRILLCALRLREPVCRPDLTGLTAGDATLYLQDGFVTLDRELKVSRVYPAVLAVTLAPAAAGDRAGRAM